MACKKNYKVAPIVFTAGMLWFMILAIFVPILLFGVGAIIAFFRLFFSPITSGDVPIWVIFVGGIILIIMIRRKKEKKYTPPLY